ncbi:MAG: ribbon-helix-helix domain-containing protein [Alphaproteobacteria bacterium]
MSNVLNMRLSEEIAQRLDALSKETNRPKSFYIRKLIDDYLDDIEDIYLSEKSLEELRAGRQRSYSTDEVRKEILDS